MHTGSSSKMPHRVEWTNQVVPVHIGKANYLLVPAANQFILGQNAPNGSKFGIYEPEQNPFPVGGEGLRLEATSELTLYRRLDVWQDSLYSLSNFH